MFLLIKFDKCQNVHCRPRFRCNFKRLKTLNLLEINKLHVHAQIPTAQLTIIYVLIVILEDVTKIIKHYLKQVTAFVL